MFELVAIVLIFNRVIHEGIPIMGVLNEPNKRHLKEKLPILRNRSVPEFTGRSGPPLWQGFQPFVLGHAFEPSSGQLQLDVNWRCLCIDPELMAWKLRRNNS